MKRGVPENRRRMYGYINVNKEELRVKELYEFRSFYCGLCRMLGKRYGVTGRLTLSYDMTFLILLLTSLYEPEVKTEKHRCPVHPMRRNRVAESPFTEYAADMNMALAVKHFEDDKKDEKSMKASAGLLLYGRHYQRIKERYPRQCGAIERELDSLSRFEAENSKDFEEVSGTFGRLMAEIFVYEEDRFSEDLRRTGFFLGKFIYLTDACLDAEEDKKRGRYNPFSEVFEEEGFRNGVEGILLRTMSFCTEAFERLPLVKDIDILRNILYDGVWTKFYSENAKNGGAE